jgi:pSer/pThr/pTyr-binding forkhead associated (FHA) protein
MDDSPKPGEAAGRPLQGPHVPGPDRAATAARFVPLRLVLKPGGTALELTRPDMLIGRHSDADVRLALPDISRRHCRVVFASDRWQVFDLNSLNGVYVNGDRVQQATLDTGDRLQIGCLTFHVEVGSAPEGVAEPGKDVLGTRPHVLKSRADEGHNPDSRKPQRKAS